MAGILKNRHVRRTDCLISLLVVGPGELCQLIAEGLHQSARQKYWSIVVHKTESIARVVRHEREPAVDFIVFAFNSTQSLVEVEDNISLVNSNYIVAGCACLVNCNSVSNVVGLTSYKSAEIRDKYNIRFFSADVFDREDRIELGNRILNVAEAILGLSSGIPNMGCLTQHN